MDREPPPVTVTAPGSGGPPPDLLDSAPTPSRPPPAALVLGLLLVVVLGATAVRSGPPPAPDREPVPARPPRTSGAGVTASAALGGAATDERYVQRLTLTVDLPASAGRGDSRFRPHGDEVLLRGVRLRGFTVETDDPRSPLPLGSSRRADADRSTTVSVAAVVDDCSIEPQARRDIDLLVRTGDGNDAAVRAVADADVVRALDRLVSRACRRPRG